MGAFDDLIPAKSGGAFDDLIPKKSDTGSRSAMEAASDIGVTLLKGAIGLPAAAVGLADIPTGGRVGKALEGIGYRPNDAQALVDDWYSSQQKAANAAVRDADGFAETLAAGIANPTAVGAAALESIPQMLGGAGVARGILKLAPKVAPWLAGAAGEGVLAAGAAANEARSKSADGLLSGRQAAAAVGSGVGTAAFGAAGGKLAQRLGLGDVDTMLAAGTSKLSKAPPGFVRQVLGSGISEGLFEELPQSIQEKMWENWGNGRPLGEGVGNAAAMGLMTGAAMGAAGGGYSAARNRGTPAAPGAPAEPAAPGATPEAPIDAAEVLGAATPEPPAAAAPASPTEAPSAASPIPGNQPFPESTTQPDPAQDALTAEPTAESALPKVRAVPGLATTFSTETGARLDAAYSLVEADDLVTSHDTNLRTNPAYPPELQPRQRERAASAQQISSIQARLDPARLGMSADAGTGAPIVGDDGLVESGNARTIALKRVYEAAGQKAEDYKAYLRANAAQFGLTPEQIDGMRQPVLVRVRTTPVNRAEFARQANASTVAQMAPSELAKADANRIDAMDDLRPDDAGDFATSREFIRRFMSRLPVTEQAGMIDATGRLSSAGYARVRNAVLAKAYGDSPVLTRMVESMDDNQRNITKALMIAAPRVAQARGAIADGRRFDADITPHLIGAAESLSRLKESGTSVDDALAQAGLMGDEHTPETRELIRFLADNVRRPRRMADFITAYFDALDAAGDPAQGSLLGDTQAPTTTDLMGAARRSTGETDAASNAPDAKRRNDREAAPAGNGPAGQPADAPGGRGGAEGDGAAGASPNVEGEPQDSDWVKFASDSGTLGIPRAYMPQFPAEANGALTNYLAARGIAHELEEVPARSLKPTQAEYSPTKVARAGKSDSGAAIPVSSDGYVIDGHHRWLAKAQTDSPIAILRLSAPAQQVLDIATNFPSADVDPDSPVAKRAAAVAEFKEAAGDLARILTKHQRAAMVPEDTPGLMDTLTRLFTAAVKIAGTDLRAATKWVREQMRLDPALKPLANKIDPATFKKAALRAIEQAEVDDMLGGQARQAGETDKAFAKRVVDKRPAPAALPENHGDYFNMSGARVVPIASLVSTKSAEENAQGGENGAKRMAAAAAGELAKRGPITVMPAATDAGKYEVVDGNGTLTSVSKYGWKSMPVTVVTREEGLRLIAEDKAKDAAKAAKPANAAMIDGRPYDMKRDNFKPPAPKDVFTPELLAQIDGFIERYYKDAAPYEISTEERARGEALMAPRLALAADAKADYDAKVLAVAKRTGAVGQMLAPLKGIKRAVEKMHQDAAEAGRDMDPADVKDLLRSTIVVRDYADADEVIAQIRTEFDVLRVKDRREPDARAKQGGYSDVLINVRMPNGTTAEIQVNIPAMLTAKAGKNDKPVAGAGGHQLYEAARVLPDSNPKKAEIFSAMTVLYEAAFAANARDFAAQATKADSVIGAPLAGSDLTATSEAPSSDALKMPPSGKRTNSSPENDAKNSQPAGNLSGNFIAPSPVESVPQNARIGYSQPDLFGDGNATRNDRTGAEGQGAQAARGPQGRGQAEPVPAGTGRSGQRAGGQRGAAAAAGRRVGQPGVGGVGAPDADGGKPGARGRARRGAAVPAGRDIKPKSGLNYRLTDDDLTYQGSWQKKAERNIEAVELLKRLQAENRQATPAEQRTLAQFIGWGSSEIANSLFGKKLDKDAEALRNYERAVQAFEKRGNRPMVPSRYSGYLEGYYDALAVLRNADPTIPAYGSPEITREALDKAAPAPATRRWVELRDRLKAALTADEWAAASRTTQYAHFTSGQVVRSMWAAMERMGFKGGTILEPGAGSGVFPGLMPDAIAANSAYTGIEYDPITGGILKQLQPDERILVESFVDTKLPRNFYDVAIGNPPFSGTKILSDPAYAKHAFALHDYFFAKTIDSVKPGGLVMFVTSRYTMDKRGDKARAYMAERADLVGAIRLPQTAFQANAGTEVVTDVLFLRKKVPGQTFDKAQPWLNAVETQTKDGPAWVNEYFAKNPSKVLGTPALQGSMYSANEYTVLPPEGDIEALFAKAVESMPADVYTAPRGSAAEAAQVRGLDFNPKAKKEGNYYVTDAGVLMQLEGGVGIPVDLKKPADMEVIKDFVPLRDALKQAHYDQLNDGDWEASLKALQDAHAAFVAKHGAVNQSVVRQVRVKVDELDEDGEPTGRRVDDTEDRRVFPLLNKLQDDPDWTLVAALEKVNDETGEVSPGSFLTSRVLGKPAVAEVATPSDALLAVLNDTGKVDVEAIAERLDMDTADAIEALGSAIYQNPEGDWETADQYLSGNVKRKLEVAEAAARTDRRFERNVEALRAAQPAAKNPSQINVSIGMNWIPGEHYARFLQEKAGIKSRIGWNEATRQWVVTFGDGTGTMKATADWGTPQRHAGELLEHALTGRPIKISKSVGTGEDRKSVFDPEATEAANAKLELLKDAFSTWVWEDAARADQLVRIYNDKFNTTVPRAFDGRHLSLPGASKKYNIFDHVKRGAWRIVQSGNTYLAHAVGSGKTFQMVISAMEQKRLGMIKKPMMVVPNHMLQQFAREWQDLYPAAKLMVADEHNFHTENRRRWVSRVALSDLDGVIITHSAFKLLDLDPKYKAKIIDEQLDYLRAALEQAEEDDGKGGKKSPRVKQIEKQIENLEEKLKKSLSSEGKDKNVRFDETGVDMLYVDEAHAYRKLDFGTSRQVKGIAPEGSAQALDLYIKARYLDEKRPGRSLVMASGTPVTNTLAELYTVQRFLGRQALIDRGIEDFDSWAAMFGRERTSLEANAAGKYEPVTRFSKFVNVPELTQMFREFADVVTGDQLAALLGDDRPKVEGGSRKIVVTPKTAAYADYQKVLAARYEASRAWRPSKDEPNNPDPVIKIIGDGRLAAIDMRFVNPSLPSDPGSKLNRMIDEVIAQFKATASAEFVKDKKSQEVEATKGATMMVFSDLGFGSGVAATRGFNARAWFEKRLRDAGVPPAQVAFMQDFKKSTDKLKLFRDLNAGRVRILIGSSKNMGTGVNAQQRLLNLFHLDSPWFPADLEQREGRIIRQGNKHAWAKKPVRIFAYAAKGSYDETMWGMLARKQFFIDQALAGDENLREVEDLDSAGQYDMAAALVAEDPRVLQLAGLKAEAEKLQRLYRAHEDQRMGFRSEFLRMTTTAEYLGKLLPDATERAKQVRDLSGDRFVAKAGRQSFTDRAEWGDALKAVAKDLAARVAESQTIGDVSGFPIRFVSRKTESEYAWHVELDTPEKAMLITWGDENPVGMAMRATNAVADVARAPERIRAKMQQARDTADALRPRLETPFPMLEILTGKLKEASDLEAEIAASSKDRPWRVERKDTGLGFEVQAHNAERAIEKAVESNGGTADDRTATEATPPQANEPSPAYDAAENRPEAGARGAQYGNAQGDLFNQQLDLFLDSKPVPSQTGPGVDEARRVAADALRLLRRSGTVLGRALSGGLAERQRTNLVGQVAKTPADLALLAQVYRDPRFETFRVFFTNSKGAVVAQAGLTSRLPGSTSAIVGRDAREYLTKMLPKAKAAGATGFFMLHNHPSGRSEPSTADEFVTRLIALNAAEVEPSIKFKGHVVIDTNEYAEINARGEWKVKKTDFGAIEPHNNGEAWAGTQISSPQDVMELTKRLEVTGDAVTLMVLNFQNRVMQIATVPGAAMRGTKAAATAAVRRAILAGTGAKVVAVSRDQAAIDNVVRHRLALDAVLVTDDGKAVSAAALAGVAGSARALPDDRGVRVTADTTPEFDYLRQDALESRVNRAMIRSVVGGGRAAEPAPKMAKTDTPEFKRWFGDSKTVDRQGEPMVFYHGTTADFSTFKPNEKGLIFVAERARDAERIAGVRAKQRQGSMYNPQTPGVADGQSTMPVFVSAKNPFDHNIRAHSDPLFRWLEGQMLKDADLRKRIESAVRLGREPWMDDDDASLNNQVRYGNYLILEDPAVIAWLKSGGYDSFFTTELDDDEAGRTLALFEPNQIKSAISNTTFDPNNPSILAEPQAAGYGANAAPTAAERAESLIQDSAATPAPVDAAFRLAARVTGIQRATTMLYGMGARLIDRITPERVKAGVVSDYGVPEAVIDQRAQMQGSQRAQLKQAGALLEKLATMTRAESRVAYEWMSGDDTRTADELMKDLPEESVKVLEQVRQMVDQLSQEALRLGQLDAEAFKRHRFAYLRRSYFKHATELTASEKTSRQRAISILGDQYKGRGMTAKAPMRQVQNIAPEWWKRKLEAGKADTSLKGEKFERLERRAPRGDGTVGLDGMGENTRPGRLLEVHFWPAGEPKPAKYADWESAGTWEVRDTKAGDLVMWRDFTKAERVKMGEIDEARYAIAKTLHRMVHDVEVGRYLEWLSRGYAKKPGEEFAGTLVEASERFKDAFKPGEWVQVPDTTIPGTSVKKYGALAGRYLPGPIWNDLRQVVNGRFQPLGENYQKILSMWKTAKTALSPGVHTNNIMSNFVMADWHDVSAGHVSKALRILLAAQQGDGKGALGRAGNAAMRLGVADRAAAREILNRYQVSGGAIGGWITQEIANDQLEPILAALQAEVATTAAAAAPTEIGVYSALQHLMHARFAPAWEAFKGSRPASAVATDAQNLINLYQAEDDVFRLAAWLKAKEAGSSDAEAGKASRKSFLDYSINAPWVAAMRSTAWPFIAFTYRAVPMLLETFAKKPHKIIKLMALAGALNWLGVMLGGGGDDKERKLLPEEKAGRIWGMVPKLIRMPWNDANGSPVYLDIRRWIPVGDVVDLGAGQAAMPLPPAAYPGGPLVILLEIAFNKSAFTGKPITLETDTAAEKATKLLDHLWKAAMPNIIGVPGTYATEGVVGAAKGRTDAFGREMSVPMAVSSAMGVKLGAYPEDVLRRNLLAKKAAEESEIDREISALKRQRRTNQIDDEELADGLKQKNAKKQDLARKLAEQFQ